MEDLARTIEPKSDQMNADDLIAGPITITVRKVSAAASSADQPVSIFYENDNGKPFKPSKSMRRVMVQIWGRDGEKYIGKSMTLYRDPTVKFGGMEVGGIRISHMSDIDKPMTLVLTESKAKRKSVTIQPLQRQQTKHQEPIDNGMLLVSARDAASDGKDSLQAYWKTLTDEEKEVVNTIIDELKKSAINADEAKSKTNEPDFTHDHQDDDEIPDDDGSGQSLSDDD